MANILPLEKQTMVIHALAEGSQELVVVKELPPVVSPETGLRAYIVSKK